MILGQKKKVVVLPSSKMSEKLGWSVRFFSFFWIIFFKNTHTPTEVKFGYIFNNFSQKNTHSEQLYWVLSPTVILLFSFLIRVGR